MHVFFLVLFGDFGHRRNTIGYTIRYMTIVYSCWSDQADTSLDSKQDEKSIEEF